MLNAQTIFNSIPILSDDQKIEGLNAQDMQMAYLSQIVNDVREKIIEVKKINSPSRLQREKFKQEMNSQIERTDEDRLSTVVSSMHKSQETLYSELQSELQGRITGGSTETRSEFALEASKVLGEKVYKEISLRQLPEAKTLPQCIINFIDPNGVSFFQDICSFAPLWVIQLVEPHAVNIQRVDDRGWTALTHALSGYQHISVIQHLVQDLHFEVNQASPVDQVSNLYFSLIAKALASDVKDRKNSEKVCEFLIAQGACILDHRLLDLEKIATDYKLNIQQKKKLETEVREMAVRELSEVLHEESRSQAQRTENENLFKALDNLKNSSGKEAIVKTAFEGTLPFHTACALFRHSVIAYMPDKIKIERNYTILQRFVDCGSDFEFKFKGKSGTDILSAQGFPADVREKLNPHRTRLEEYRQQRSAEGRNQELKFNIV